MSRQVFRIPRITDQQIAASLMRLSNEIEKFKLGFNAVGNHIGEVEFPGQGGNAAWSALVSLKSELIDHFGGTIAGVAVSYHRGGESNNLPKSPVLDDLCIDYRGASPERFEVIAKILQAFRPVPLPAPSAADETIVEMRAIQESTFARLQRQTEFLFEQTIELRQKLDESVQRKEAALEESFQNRQQVAEAALEKRLEALRAEEEALDAKRKAIDDSDNRHARRQIRDRMLADVSARVQNFDMSQATLSARKPVAIGIFALLGFLIFLAVVSYRDLATLSPNSPAAVATSNDAAADPKISTVASQSARSVFDEQTLSWLRFSLILLGITATLYYYIKWQNNWATQFAETEQALKRFHIDVNRANWVVETCLEWHKETKSEIPAPLVDSLTRGLFVDREPATQVLHPADELASALLGSASRLQLDVAGNKVEIDKPSRIPKSISSAGQE